MQSRGDLPICAITIIDNNGSITYMIENNVIQIIFDNLKEYIEIEDIYFFPSNGVLKYLFVISNYNFEIEYNFMDNFYRIKLEKPINNEFTNVVFLTKSKRFQKDIKLVLKNLKISKKSFDNHIYAFTAYLSWLLKKYKGLSCLEEIYTSDLKFDGIFI